MKYSKPFFFLLSILFFSISCKNDDNGPISSSENSIITFEISGRPEFTGAINNQNNTIVLNLGNFNYSGLVPIIEVSENATVIPSSGIAQNFNNDLSYTVTAENGLETTYDIIVNSGQNEILSFVVENNGDEFIGAINNQNNMINLDLGNFDYSSLTPIIEVSENAMVTPSNSSQNFNNDLSFTVIAENGSENSYDIIVNSGQNEILSFIIENEGTNFVGVIDNETNTISLNLGNFDYSNLTPIIEVSENAMVTPSNSSQNFNNDLSFTVIAENGSENTYDIIVSSGQNEITSFIIEGDRNAVSGINGNNFTGIIDNENNTISLNLGNFDYSSLIPTIQTSDNTTIDLEGPINLNNNIQYTVTSQVGTSRTYTVITPLGLSSVFPFFGQGGYSFNEDSISTRFICFVGSDLNFSINNVSTSNRSNLSISLVSTDNTYPLEVIETTNTIKTIIPNNVPAGIYTYLVSDQQDEVFYEHQIEIINDPSVIRITGLNDTQYTRSSTMVISGENLPSTLIIKSNGFQFLFSDSVGNITRNANNTEMQIDFSFGFTYGNISTGPRMKSFTFYTTIDGYPYRINSNTAFFSL